MADRPILFSGPMVRALLAGRKTQTRRLATSPLAKVQVGDLLWVRETWRPVHSADPSLGARYRVDAGLDQTVWRPSIHMPRWASRLTLEVTEVRIQHLQDITEDDAFAEGVERLQVTIGSNGQPLGWNTASVRYGDWSYNARTAREAFAHLWQTLHGEASDEWEAPLDAPAWAANPEVVALTFTVHRSNIDALLSQQRVAA